MDRRLFADHIRRHGGSLAAVASIAAALWFAASFDPEGAHWAMAGSLVLAFVAGPLRTFRLLAPLEVQILPISRGSIWRTGWWLSVVVAIGVTTTGKVIGLAAAHLLSSHPEVSLDMVWLSTTYDLAQAGVLIIVVRGIQAASRESTLARAPRTLLITGAIMFLVASMLWPVLIFRSLPVRWHELNAATAGIVVLGLALTVLNYFVPPARVGMPSRHAIQAGWRSSKRKGSWPRFDRITGLGRLVFQTWKAAVFMQVGISVVVIGTMAAVNLFMHGEAAGSLPDLRDFGFLPFDGNPTSEGPSSFFVLYFLGGAGLVWPFAMVGHQDVLQFMLRHLRTLPLSTRALNALMLTLPLVSWINLWLVLLVFHFAMSGGPIASLRLAEWLALVGIDAVIRAMYLRWRSYLWPGIFGTSILVTSFLVTRFAFGALPALAGSTGAVALLLAWALNHDTLTRSRLAYSRVPVSPQIAALQPEP